MTGDSAAGSVDPTGPSAAGSFLTLPSGRPIVVTDAAEARYLVREIYEQQIYSFPTALGARPTVVDAGANIGVFALFACERLNAARVHAFEAIPDVRELLRANTEHYPEIVVQDEALGSHEAVGEAFVYYPRHTVKSGRHTDAGLDASAIASALVQQSAHSDADVRRQVAADADDVAEYRLGNSQRRTCDVTTLDAFLGAADIAQVDLLKIDVEGDEAEVLAGMRHLAHRVRTVIVEADQSRGTVELCESWLRRYGFTVTRTGELHAPGFVLLYATREPKFTRY